jgi:outer membrane protein OmpA-like peptidoglycan-associated protein
MRTPIVTFCFVAALMSLVPLSLEADPTLYGGKGLLHLLSADNEGTGGFALGLAGAYWQNADYPFPAADHQDFCGIFSATYVPIEWAELFAAGEWRSFSEKDPGQSESGLGDTKLGLKLSTYAGSPLSVAFLGDITFDTGDEEKNLSNGARQWSTRALFTLDMTQYPGSFPFRVHMNIGYHVNELNKKSDDDATPLGLGIEFPFRPITPSIEFTSEQFIHQHLATMENPMRITPGLRLAHSSGFRFTGGLDVNIAKSLPDGEKIEPYDWRLLFGIAYLSPGEERGKKRIGTIAGEVRDAETGDPLAATIRLPQHPEYPPVQSDPSTGIFTLKGIPVGVATVEASRAEYMRQVVPVVVKADEVSIQDFALVPIAPPEGEVMGRVTDGFSGQPVRAILYFSGPTSDSVLTVPDQGAYTISLPPGSYVIHVKAEGYTAASATVIVESEGAEVQDFVVMKKEGLPQIRFAFGKAVIRPESYRTLEEVARFLRVNPDVKLEIHGHTDDVGSEEFNLKLSQDRANAAKDALIERYNISPDRLIARWFGESQPIATNLTEEGRRLNRRIEFVIMK